MTKLRGGLSSELTPAEIRIVKLLCCGKNTNKIAEETHLSRKTIRNSLQNISDKTGIRGELNLLLHFHEIFGCDKCTVHLLQV